MWCAMLSTRSGVSMWGGMEHSACSPVFDVRALHPTRSRYVGGFAGLLHCLDAKTGKQHWTYDAFAMCWESPVLINGKLYVADGDGDIAIFPHTADPKKALKKGKDGMLLPALGVQKVDGPVWSMPVVANGVLFITTRGMLYAIATDKKKVPIDR